MKKPSKIWKEFCQIISIVDIGIGKQQRKLVKLYKHKELLLSNIVEFSVEIESQQEKLNGLAIGQEHDSIKLFFRRKDNLKSSIESLFFDASLLQNELDELSVEINKTEVEKLRLEKRKDILEELKKQIS